MTHFIKGIPREQLQLISETLDDIISAENPVRFIDAYVDKIDLLEAGFNTPELRTGTNPYAPALLLKIYIYSYMNKIRSSRKIEKECHRNIEMKWLTGNLAPDFKTIADFRKNNPEGLKNIFKEFLKLCYKLDLLSFSMVAIDGTKLKAQNSMRNIYKRDQLKKIEKVITEKINDYIHDLDNNDQEEKVDFNFLTKDIQNKIAMLKKKKDKINAIKDVFEANPGLDSYFAGDPECSFQKGNGQIKPGYNCQSGVDSKHKLIIVNDVTAESSDARQLIKIQNKINDLKKEFEVTGITATLADAGYYSENNIIEVDANNSVDLYLPNPRDAKTKEKSGKETKNKIPARGFEKEDFQYDEQRDCFICPRNKLLSKKTAPALKGNLQRIKYYGANCAECSVKNLCTKSNSGRTIAVSTNMKKINAFREKVTSKFGKTMMKKRKELVEHPFGTIKQAFGYRYFMQKGKSKVKSEFSFISFIYNFKRVLNIVSLNDLITAIS